MLQDFLNSFNEKELSKLSLQELVKMDKTLSFYEATTPLLFYRNKINQEFIKRRSKFLRFEVHEINTGYKPEDWYTWENKNLSMEQRSKLKKRINGRDENYGWKFHLDVIPNRNHPVTREISDFLLELGVSHKISGGGDNGKGMTVYVGSYDDTIKLAHIIHEKFGSKIYTPPVYTDQVRQEYAFEPTVYGRFCMSGYGRYPDQEIVGISTWVLSVIDDVNMTYTIADSLGEVSEHNFLEKSTIKPQSESDKKLATYCSHKLCATIWGKFYYGNSLKDFENKFFGNKIPAIGTQKRKNWDEIAKVFIENIRRKRKDNFDKLSEEAKKYIPIDFSSIKSVNNISSKWEQDTKQPSYRQVASKIGKQWE